MVGWHHQLDRHGFGWTLRAGDGQGGLTCCSSWGHRELETHSIDFILVRVARKYKALCFPQSGKKLLLKLHLLIKFYLK